MLTTFVECSKVSLVCVIRISSKPVAPIFLPLWIDVFGKFDDADVELWRENAYSQISKHFTVIRNFLT